MVTFFIDNFQSLSPVAPTLSAPVQYSLGVNSPCCISLRRAILAQLLSVMTSVREEGEEKKRKLRAARSTAQLPTHHAGAALHGPLETETQPQIHMKTQERNTHSRSDERIAGLYSLRHRASAWPTPKLDNAQIICAGPSPSGVGQKTWHEHGR